MKKIYIYLFLAIISSSPLIAQTSSIIPSTKKFKRSEINFGIGVNWNTFESMTLDELLIFAKDPEQLKRDLQGLEEETTPNTAGADLRVGWSFSPLNSATGNYKTNQALQVGIILNSPKEAMVSYKNKDLDTSIVFCNIHWELGLNASYVFKGTWGKRDRWNWYAGAGANAGFTFGNNMMLINGKYFEPGEHPSTQPVDDVSPEPEMYEAKSVSYTRVFIPYGIHYKMGKRVLLGLDLSKGIGWQRVGKDKMNYMKKSSGFAIGLKYLL